MRLGAFVITYRRPAALTRTVETLLAQSVSPGTVLIMDNGASEGSHDESSQALAGFGGRVQVRSMRANLGPAGAAAEAIAELMATGFSRIVWVDDDDPPRTPNALERLLAVLDSDQWIAMAGAFGSRWDWRRGRVCRIPDRELEGIVDVDVIGGSAHPILRASAAREIGLPRPELFFGVEEWEYALRLGRSGYRLAVDGDLMHEYRVRAGRLQRNTTRSLLPPYPLNDLWRRYYTTRNLIHSLRRTFGRSDLARRIAVRALVRSLSAWGRGPRYGARYSHLQLLGILDGYRDRLGRTLLPRPKEIQS